MKAFAQGFLGYSDSSPTPFHACKSSASLLEGAGFVRLTEDVPWGPVLVRGGKYYFTRNGSTLCAFVVGKKFKSGNGFKIIGAHTDSPVLKVKPISKRSAFGVEQVGVETYGGGLWHTWFDRDLGIAGRVVYKTGNESFTQQLVHIQDPILRVATLCIHLQSTSERAAFAPNTETEVLPLLSNLSEELNSTVSESSLDPRHSPKLLILLAQELGISPDLIVDFELTLTDTQKATFGGAVKEFVFAPRIDNQLHCYIATRALIDQGNLNDPNDDGVEMITLFDHEEVGSGSNEGAAGPLMRDTFERITTSFYDRETGDKTTPIELIKTGLAKSILFSADMAHAVHPNYSSKHEAKNAPLMGKGTVIKTNMGQKYATNGVTGFFVRELARQNKVGYFEEGAAADGAVLIPIQEFVVRNDSPSGSTIGPILAKGVGIRTVDVGVPQLSMHSIREQCAVRDLWACFYLFKAFFKDALTIDRNLTPPDMMLL